MNNWRLQEQQTRKVFFQKELKKIFFNYSLSSRFLSLDLKFYFYYKFLFFTKTHALSFFRHKCLMHDWSRSIFRKFKMSRHQSKFFASFGLISGLRKSSF